MKPIRPQQKGSAYVLILWAFVLLSVTASLVLARADHLVSDGTRIKERAQARAVADGLLARGFFTLLDRAERARLPADGTPVEAVFLDHVTRLSIQDEYGRADLNTADPVLLQALFEQAGFSSRDSEALTQDLEELRRADGFHSHDGLIRHESALLDLPGMTEDAYGALSPLVTVHTRTATIDPWAAPVPVLLAVSGPGGRDIEAFAAARRLARKPALPQALANGPFAQSPGRLFRVRAEVDTPGGGTVVREAVVALETRAKLAVLSYR